MEFGIKIRTNFDLYETEKKLNVGKFYPDNNVFGFKKTGRIAWLNEEGVEEIKFINAASCTALFCYALKRCIAQMMNDEVPIDYKNLTVRFCTDMGCLPDEYVALTELIRAKHKLTAPFQVNNTDVFLEYGQYYLGIALSRLGNSVEVVKDAEFPDVFNYLTKILKAIHEVGYFAKISIDDTHDEIFTIFLDKKE